MARKYPFYPAWVGKGESAIINKVVELCGKRWGTKSIGTYNVRLMKNDHTAGKKPTDPGMDKYLSVHSTGFAADIQYPNEKVANEMWNYFVKYSEQLKIAEIHHYSYGDFGRGYRCSRGAGQAGVKTFTKDDNAGSYQGSPNWLHLEVEDCDPVAWEAFFRANKE